ncbi:MAG: hypothetical protein NTZ24_11570 [Deltaproteobacteria bacterium]|nr:hypothetical protein [Deltaproteobacteria bacterium]
MASLTVSLQSPIPAASIQETAQVFKITPATSLTLGERLEVRVLGFNRDQKILLQIKNDTLLADSRLSFQVGDKVTVRVDQLHPGLVLRIINGAEDSLKANEFLKLYRSYPGALKDLIISLKDAFSGESLKAFSQYISVKDIQAVHKVMEHIIISKVNSANPLFFKDYIVSLGLILERKLMKALSDPVYLNDENNGQTLKEILLKLSSKLQTLQATPDFTDLEMQQKINKLSNFADHALGVIESLQVVNVLAQEQDHLYVIQLPFQCPDGIRMQDIFIEKDRENHSPGRGSQYRLVLFLDMDALGEVAVDAGIRDRSLRCTIKCRHQNICDFISSLLPELEEKLSAIGYDAINIQCVLERNLPEWKQDFLNDHKLFCMNTINVCI